MDEERMLAEIEQRLAEDDPMLAARLTTFRLPRLALGPRSPRGRLTASLLMLVVVAAVSICVYALMPFRGQNAGNPASHGSAAPSHPAVSATGKGTSPPSIGPSNRATLAPLRGAPRTGTPRTGSSPSGTHSGPANTAQEFGK
jgi:hypothetical protein